MQDLSKLTREELEKLAAEQETKIAEQAEKITDLQAEVDLSLEVNKELTLQIEEGAATPVLKDLSKASVSAKTFEVENVRYSFAMPKLCLKDGHVVTADEVLASTELQQQLVNSGSGMIRKA